MRLYSSILLSFLLIATSASAQQKAKATCACPANEFGVTQDQWQSSYRFSNGKELSIFGDKNNNYLSEFILVDCLAGKTIEFWGAVETCTVKKMGDTLLITELTFLPNGVNNKYEPTDWLMHYYYYSNNTLQRSVAINRNIKRYTPQEIKTILEDFDSRSGKYTVDVEPLMDKLWLATISGDKTARNYFENFEKKFDWLDGAYSEQYHDLKAKLELWDNNQIK
ncbi:MAG: hypothetical protein EOP51_09265 [Sphingobacteriales bacterium]|nr:MAG: hypothetical protein EOP51_09265 [Sphingobacteriales bacterium]